MIINQDTQNNASFIGNIEENKVGIDKENINFITQLLTSNLYSDPLSSFFRETVSNAYDAHVEAGTLDMPIVIIIDDKGNDNYDITIRDYGTGISPERFDQIYKFIGSSTKRNTNSFIGGFGIGKFSALSCADMASVNSYYNGKEYKYAMYKNDGGINIDRLGVFPTEEHNGVEISIHGHFDDDAFKPALLGISLFKNIEIVFNQKSTPSSYDSYYYASSTALNRMITSFNSREVYEYDSFFVLDNLNSLFSYSYRCHSKLALGRVLYPTKKEIDSRAYPLLEANASTAVVIPKLEIGKVNVTPNREELIFTEKTNNYLTEVYTKVEKELATLFSNMTKDYSDKGTYIEMLSSTIAIEEPQKGATLYSPAEIGGVARTYKGKNWNLSSETRWLLRFITLREGYTALFVGGALSHPKEFTWYNYKDIDTVIIKKEPRYSKHTLDYIKKTYPNCLILTEEKARCNLKYIMQNLSKDIVKFLVNAVKIISVSNADVPESFKETNKVLPTVDDRIPLREYFPYSSYAMHKLGREFHIDKSITFIYGLHTQGEELQKIKQAFPFFTVISFTKDKVSVMEQYSNAFCIDDIKDIEIKNLKRAATAFLIEKYYQENAPNFRNDIFRIRNYFSGINKDYLEICNYIDSYRPRLLADNYILDILNTYVKNKWLDYGALCSHILPKSKLDTISKISECILNKEIFFKKAVMKKVNTFGLIDFYKQFNNC